MVYLVGGYKLTREQVLEWCHPRDLYPPVGNTTVFINHWLRSNGITQTRLLACDYHKEPKFLVVTDRKVNRNGTSHTSTVTIRFNRTTIFFSFHFL